MTKYADTVPANDKKKILDLYYGVGLSKVHEPLNRWQIAEAMNNKYTAAQVYSIILDTIDDGEPNDKNRN